MTELDRQSPVPRHAQVARLPREPIRRPGHATGRLLPDELTLAQRVGVSRGTVRAGISQLVAEGLIERSRGVGTRVRQGPARSGIRAWRSFSREMAAKGITVENCEQKYHRVPASAAAARALQIPPGTPSWRLERVRGWSSQPMLYSVSWFPPSLGLTGQEEFSGPLCQTLQAATGARPQTAREEFLAANADARLARLPETTLHAPLLLRRHTVVDGGHEPVEFAEVYYVSSRFTLTL